jgi:prepilin-type N-terminal cleavage/methylation domain-containing protein
MALNLNDLRFSKIISHKSKGLTLIEIIISVAILALALSLTSGVLISVVKSANKQSAIRELDINGQRFLLLKMCCFLVGFELHQPGYCQ